MAPPERRKTSLIQQVSLGLLISTLVSVASLAFWTGQQAQQIQEMRQEQDKQRIAASASQQTIGAAVARIDVIENKGESTQALVRDLKGDLNERLRRIEDKVDASRRR